MFRLCSYMFQVGSVVVVQFMKMDASYLDVDGVLVRPGAAV